MSTEISRRSMIKWAGASVVVGGLATQSYALSKTEKEVQSNKEPTLPLQDKWGITHDRVWVGGEYWANPMEDWRVKDGYVESLSLGGNRSVHSLTHQITDPTKGFEISVVVERLEKTEKDGGGGIRLGARSELNDVRSNCFVQRGYDMGIVGQKLVLANKYTNITEDLTHKQVRLELKATPVAGAVTLTLVATLVDTDEKLSEVTHIASSDELIGNVGIVSNFEIESTYGPNIPEKSKGSRYRFKNLFLTGSGFTATKENKFGPILWSMYTVNNTLSSDGYVLTLSAYTGPLGQKDNKVLELQIKSDGKWRSYGNSELDNDAWLATFRIANWDASKKCPYRVLYVEKHKNDTESIDVFEGVIQAEPKGRPLRMAAFTCQNDYAFPYAPVASNVAALDPDILFFSGDQIYESHGGFGVVRSPDDKAILNYLRKYYQFGWAFKEIMRNTPTICIPDDHDILQGNMWGEGGVAMKNPERDPSASILTGYIHSPKFVNVVHKTHTAHHPAPDNPHPKAAVNGIIAYYGEMVYGNVGFAILADRQFKSGPDRVDAVVGVTGRDEHPLYVNDSIDSPELHLLGDEQEAFLESWGRKWDGHELKAVLSQTILASIATHNGGADKYLKYDFDSNGWPATARNRAVRAMRESMAIHICGDTHLASISQYGVDKQRDSNWAFCVPAIGAGWQRFWFPETVGLPVTNKPRHGLANTGEYMDAFGTKNYVYAVANPVAGVSKNRYVKAQEKGSGFGFITFDTLNKTYQCTAYRFLADVTNNKANNIYPGWPLTIYQHENMGINRIS
ncbi:twin-arginine translocation pathway signal [Vibrio sp. SM6]|uniref:Twin-arginine translocation pathway signal n=2 Tax=Vibrio agarilyticus TaxID=2726741 RepID=A0A7X8YI36_9VIBR|nr:twin-arginine translocation pathway signal [Vibrio agarilyticus]